MAKLLIFIICFVIYWQEKNNAEVRKGVNGQSIFDFLLALPGRI
jgi:hypothetical protein